MSRPNSDMYWCPVERGLPDKGRPIEMMDEMGTLLTGHHDGQIFCFRGGVGTGEAIVWWRYSSGRLN